MAYDKTRIDVFNGATAVIDSIADDFAAITGINPETAKYTELFEHVCGQAKGILYLFSKERDFSETRNLLTGTRDILENSLKTDLSLKKINKTIFKNIQLCSFAIGLIATTGLEGYKGSLEKIGGRTGLDEKQQLINQIKTDLRQAFNDQHLGRS